MSNYNHDNFKASADVLEMSAKDFKALVKKRYGYSAKRGQSLYDYLHGNTVSISEEVSSDDDQAESGEDFTEIVPEV